MTIVISGTTIIHAFVCAAEPSVEPLLIRICLRSPSSYDFKTVAKVVSSWMSTHHVLLLSLRYSAGCRKRMFAGVLKPGLNLCAGAEGIRLLVQLRPASKCTMLGSTLAAPCFRRIRGQPQGRLSGNAA